MSAVKIHWRCETCGANGSGSRGSAADLATWYARDHAFENDHRVFVWPAGRKEDGLWIEGASSLVNR